MLKKTMLVMAALLLFGGGFLWGNQTGRRGMHVPEQALAGASDKVLIIRTDAAPNYIDIYFDKNVLWMEQTGGKSIRVNTDS